MVMDVIPHHQRHSCKVCIPTQDLVNIVAVGVPLAARRGRGVFGRNPLLVSINIIFKLIVIL